MEAPDLPEISLPISTTALPKISFGFQTTTTSPPAAVSKPVFSTGSSYLFYCMFGFKKKKRLKGFSGGNFYFFSK